MPATILLKRPTLSKRKKILSKISYIKKARTTTSVAINNVAFVSIFISCGTKNKSY
jgi:hypothetical protein